MVLTHISNLYALARGLRTAFANAQSQNNSNITHKITNVLQNNAHLLTYYYQSHAKDWQKLCRVNPIHYQKTWLSLDNIPLEIEPNEQLSFGIAVLTWLPGQMTDIHRHPENGCIMMPLRGKLTEERFKVNELLPNNYLSVQKNIIMPGETSFINNNMGVHQIKNNDPDTIAVSLHVYSPVQCKD